ncbi:MAG: hypothetical protein KDA24_22580 [Deltaproteobacteria bacterium]|nr:hypothetical protein [Deltaproteobacteria bacterium]
MTLTKTVVSRALALATLPLLFGFTDCGGAFFSQDEAPDMNGDWAISYDEAITVDITLGGATYTSELGLNGGTVEIEVDGQPITFDLDCADDNVTCPSEVWAAQVALEQRDPDYPSRVWLPTERQVCGGEEIEPVEDQCGEGTDNPDCDLVCDGEMVTEEVAAFGLVSAAGDEFAMLLGAGVATNGVNCAMLGVSSAEGAVTTSGGGKTDDAWVAEVVEGDITVAYAGACLWADDIDDDEELEALVLGASLSFHVGFDATRVETIAAR